MNDWHWGLWGALEKFELVSTQQVSTGLRLDALRSGAVVLNSEGSSSIISLGKLNILMASGLCLLCGNNMDGLISLSEFRPPKIQAVTA